MKFKKSNRNRGQIFQLIRTVAIAKHTICIKDISPPLTLDQASSNIAHLTLKGELELISGGTGKRPGRWKATKQIRSPLLTNRHLKK